MLLDTISEWFVFGLLSVFKPSGNPSAMQCKDNQLYYNATGRCYVHNETHPTQGPCRQGLVFFAEDVELPSFGHCVCPDSLTSTRTFFYHKTSKRCYGILTRGPCLKKDWIDLDIAKGPLCKSNPCKNKNIVDQVTFKGECVKLGKICEETTNSVKRNGTVSFVEGSLYPECLVMQRAIGAVRSSCAKGTYRTPDGQNCVAPISFDF